MHVSIASKAARRRCVGLFSASLRRHYRSHVATVTAAGGNDGSKQQKTALPSQTVRHHHPDPFNPKTTKGWAAALKEAEIPRTKFDMEIQHGLELGLPGEI